MNESEMVEQVVLKSGFSLPGEIMQNILPRIGAVLALALLWTVVSLVWPKIIPSVSSTIAKSFELIKTGAFFINMLGTLERVLIGFTLAFVISIPVGVIMGTSRLGEHFLDLFVVIGLTIPGLVWALIALMLFGLSQLGAIFAVATGILPTLAISIWQGVKTLDRDLVDMSTLFRASPLSKVSNVIIPHLLPFMFAATRSGLGLGWKVVVIAEMFGTSGGVGFQLQTAYQVFDMASVLAWTILFAVVMIIIEYTILNNIERRVMAWKPRANVWR